MMHLNNNLFVVLQYKRSDYNAAIGGYGWTR